jgi:hypothetical protein
MTQMDADLKLPSLRLSPSCFKPRSLGGNPPLPLSRAHEATRMGIVLVLESFFTTEFSVVMVQPPLMASTTASNMRPMIFTIEFLSALICVHLRLKTISA